MTDNWLRVPKLHKILDKIPAIECFQSRGQHLWKFIGTKESVCIRKEFKSHRTCLGHQHGHRFIVLEHQYGRHDVMWKHYKGRWIRPLVTLELMSNSRKKGHLLRVIFKNIKNLLIRAYILAWQDSWHFAMPPLASPPNDLWETSTETPLILMTCHYLELGSASDWLKQISHWHYQSETPPRSR